jgi:hypothetical protein
MNPFRTGVDRLSQQNGLAKGRKDETESRDSRSRRRLYILLHRSGVELCFPEMEIKLERVRIT